MAVPDNLLLCGGNMLVYIDNQFYSAPNPEENIKAAVLAEIDKCAATMRDKYCAPTSPYEAASWALKLSEAAKYAQTGNAADAPLLSAEAQWRGVSLAQLVSRVDGNAAQLGALEAQIAGVSGKHRDAVQTMTDEEALNYDWRSGWPG